MRPYGRDRLLTGRARGQGTIRCMRLERADVIARLGSAGGAAAKRSTRVRAARTRWVTSPLRMSRLTTSCAFLWQQCGMDYRTRARAGRRFHQTSIWAPGLARRQRARAAETRPARRAFQSPKDRAASDMVFLETLTLYPLSFRKAILTSVTG